MKNLTWFVLISFCLNFSVLSAQWGRVADFDLSANSFSMTREGVLHKAVTETDLYSHSQGDYYLRILESRDHGETWEEKQYINLGPYSSASSGFFDFFSDSRGVSWAVYRQGAAFYVLRSDDSWGTYEEMGSGGTDSGLFPRWYGGAVSVSDDHFFFFRNEDGPPPPDAFSATLDLLSINRNGDRTEFPDFFVGIGSPLAVCAFDSLSPVMMVGIHDTTKILRYNSSTNEWENTWQQHWPERENLVSVENLQVIGDSLIVACGPDGILLRSEDRGLTWEEQWTGSEEDLGAVSFWNEEVGYVGGEEGFIYKTTDSGDTWEKQFVYEGTERQVQRIRLYSENEGNAQIANFSFQFDLMELNAGAGHLSPELLNGDKNYFHLIPELIEGAELFDMQGRKIAELPANSASHFDLSRQLKGIYIIRYWYNGKPHAEKYYAGQDLFPGR